MIEIGDQVVHCFKCNKPKFVKGTTYIGKENFCNCGGKKGEY